MEADYTPPSRVGVRAVVAAGLRLVNSPRAILLVRCPDRPGIVAAISGFLFRHGANITDFDQHSSEDASAVYCGNSEITAQIGGLNPRHETRPANLKAAPAALGKIIVVTIEDAA